MMTLAMVIGLAKNTILTILLAAGASKHYEMWMERRNAPKVSRLSAEEIANNEWSDAEEVK